MRKILSLIALFSFTGLLAQNPAEVNHTNPVSGEIMIYPTEEEAARNDLKTDNRYNTHLDSWTQDDNLFSTRFTMPFAWLNRQVILRVGSTSGEYVVRVNGKIIEENSVGALAGNFDITRACHEGQNLLEIETNPYSEFAVLEDWKSLDTPFVTDVRLMSVPKLHVRDVLTSTWRADDDSDTATAQIGIIVKSEALNPRTSHIYYELYSPLGKRIHMGDRQMTLQLKGEDTLRIVSHIPYPMMWSPTNPKLYSLRIKTRHEGRFEEYIEIPVGFCLIQGKGKEMMINGERIPLKAQKVEPSITNREIDDLKLDKYNTIILKPGVVRHGLLDYCDQVGMFVVAQAPIDSHKSGLSRRKGGNPTNNPQFRDEYLKRTERMYHLTKRHPSVIAFSIAHASANGINLYESFLNLKHFADPRPMIYPDAAGEWNNDPLHIDEVSTNKSAVEETSAEVSRK